MSQRPFDVIPNQSRVTSIRYSPEFSGICRIGKAPFVGYLTVEYYPDKNLLEFESFERWLRANVNLETTIEGFCRLAFDGLCEALGDIRLRVTVHAQTTVHAPVSATIESEGWNE